VQSGAARPLAGLAVTSLFAVFQHEFWRTALDEDAFFAFGCQNRNSKHTDPAGNHPLHSTIHCFSFQLQ
jgi:hypothetical protein